MKKIVKKNYKILIGIIIGIIISTTIVYSAENILTGGDISYDNKTSGEKTVQGAIDELYSKLYDKPPITAYTYNENKEDSNYCVNGEERTCEKTDCYTKKEANSCPQGTIIKYYVRENEYHYFYVLHDNEKTITMQQRENTVRNISWNENGSSISKGPITILNALEQATSTWTNVNVIEYEPGVTELNGNKYTDCTPTEDYKVTCDSNAYTSETRKARARMITVQEASETGCSILTSNNDNLAGTCPDWMHNYLRDSVGYKGSYQNYTYDKIKESYDDYYWTMSVNFSNGNVWIIDRRGESFLQVSNNVGGGARAVVEINK